jgi:hypothetical protein
MGGKEKKKTNDAFGLIECMMELIDERVLVVVLWLLQELGSERTKEDEHGKNDLANYIWTRNDYAMLCFLLILKRFMFLCSFRGLLFGFCGFWLLCSCDSLASVIDCGPSNLGLLCQILVLYADLDDHVTRHVRVTLQCYWRSIFLLLDWMVY